MMTVRLRRHTEDLALLVRLVPIRRAGQVTSALRLGHLLASSQRWLQLQVGSSWLSRMDFAGDGTFAQ